MLVKYGHLYIYALHVRKSITTCIPVIMSYTGPPVLVSKQNQTVIVNVKEEVALNCSASSVPDPVYSWSFPHSCSSCPNTSSKNILTFIATDSGEYTCVAENEYWNLSVTFNVTVISK